MTIGISSRQEGFRRCGIAHSISRTEYADDHFSKEQLAALKAEPMLVVHLVKDEPPGPNAAKAIALVKGAADLAALDELALGEERKSVLAALAARYKELNEQAADHS